MKWWKNQSWKSPETAREPTLQHYLIALNADTTKTRLVYLAGDVTGQEFWGSCLLPTPPPLSTLCYCPCDSVCFQWTDYTAPSPLFATPASAHVTPFASSEQMYEIVHMYIVYIHTRIDRLWPSNASNPSLMSDRVQIMKGLDLWDKVAWGSDIKEKIL